MYTDAFQTKGNRESHFGAKVKSDETIRAAIEGILEDIKRISGVRPSFVYKIPVVKDLLREILRG